MQKSSSQGKLPQLTNNMHKLNGSNESYHSSVHLPKSTSKILTNNQQSGSSYMNYGSKAPQPILKTPSTQQQKKHPHNTQLSFKIKANNNSKENKFDYLPGI